MTPLRPGVSLALFVAALLGLAAPASASTYCISVADTTGCSSFTGDTGSAGARLQAAMTAALLHAGDDTIRLGTDTYDRAPDLAPGTSATFNYGTGSGNHPSAGDLTIAGDEGAAAVIANTGTAPDDETVEGYDNTLALTLRNLTIEGPPNAARSIGLEISAPGSRVERVTIKTPDEAPTGPHALYAGIAFRQYETTVSNTVISGFAKAAFTACRAGAPGAATLEHVTIVPSGTPGTTGTLDAACDHEPQDNLPAANFTMRTPVAGNPTITVTDSILGAGATVRTDAGGAIALARTRWDGTVVGSSNVTTSGATTAAPGFFSTTDFHLLP
ncbi:MAG: hypothetical protein J7513_14135, partial [Solirubrobacteraceae bacterium]|nr:hypothetical protein [Solirubrobacteraceae bacterium]